jgi:hypothetical protein
MSAAKHTPAPWGGGKDIPIRAIDQEALGFSIIYINTDSVARKVEAAANARLIAAAPDLLEAAKRIEKRIAYYASMAEAGQPNIEQWAYTDQSGDVKTLRAAIAKAEVQS